MSPPMDIRKLIADAAPYAELEQDGPARPGGAFVLDVRWRERHVVVQYSPRRGFGV